MRFGSVCSGIEAAAVAWHPLGWRAAWCAEIEPFPSSVLAHHYPTVPNMGDMTTLPALVRLGLLEAPDVLVGGTPCQAFSVAGLRNSLADDRGNLTLSYFHLLDAIDHARAERNEPACIAVWENVPGVLSTKDNAFGCFLAGLAGESDPLEPTGGKWSDAGCIVGPARTIAWRILDAQYFGLAQRRRRVFVVASARDDIDPAALLFEWEGVRRDSPPSREARQETTGGARVGIAGGDTVGTLESRSSAGETPGTDGACSGHVLPDWPAQVGCTLNAAYGDKMGLEDQHALGGASLFVPAVIVPITARMFNALGARDVQEGAVITAFSCKDSGADSGPLSPTLRAMSGKLPNGGGQVAVAFQSKASSTQSMNPSVVCPTLDVSKSEGLAVACFKGGQGSKAGGLGYSEHVAPTLSSADSGSNRTPALLNAMQVRRLTPRECERLQGFPDDYTLVPHRGKPAADGPRYKALGNSMAVPCMAWIGKRIAEALP